MPITLLVACREERLAVEHCFALGKAAGDAIAARSTDIASVVHKAAQQQPDVVLLEHLSSEEDRIWTVLRRLTLLSERSRPLILCDLCTERLVTSLIAKGASGCVPIAADRSLWVKAIVAVHNGESWFARTAMLQALRRQIASHPIVGGAPVDDHDSQGLLTIREREILALIGDGMSNKEIARHLSISDQTVKTHLHHVYVKLNRSGRYKAFMATPGRLARVRIPAA